MKDSIRQTSAPLAALLSAQVPTVLDALPAHIALLDDRGCIVAVNAAWRQFARANSFRDPDHGVGESYLEVCEQCDEPDARAVREGLAAVLAGERRQFELEYPCHAPKEQRWFRLMAAAMDRGGGTVGAVIMHVDITTLRQAEQKLQEARDAAEAANRAKDHFLAMLSHELRTPLTPVLATVSRLQDDPRLRGLHREMALVRRNVELEARLIDDLLDLTRIVRGKLELRPERIDLRQLVTHALHTCVEPERAARQLRVEVELEAADHRLWGDAPRLSQVLWNLLNNAVKFTPAGGTIRVRTRSVGEAAGDAAGERRLILEVEDTGVGIAEQTLPGIFDGFEQGEQSVTRRFGGLGLGLAISRAIVELHGGTLRAASPGVGQGATFTLELPAGPRPALGPDAAPAEAPAAAGTDSPARPLHLLLVEDHADTAEAMADLLQLLGHRVSRAGTVQAALEEAAAAARNGDSIDLVVSDVGLPDGTGLDLMRELARRHGLPGIALSGYGMEEDVRKSREAGFRRHLTKPVDLQALAAAIREEAGGER